MTTMYVIPGWMELSDPQTQCYPEWLQLGRDVSSVTAIELSPDMVLTPEQSEALGALRKRIGARLRKAKSRADKAEILLPLPAGTAAALRRVMEAAGFDDPRDFLAFQIHRLDDLRERDGHKFNQQAVRTVTLNDPNLVERYADRLNTYEETAEDATA